MALLLAGVDNGESVLLGWRDRHTALDTEILALGAVNQLLGNLLQGLDCMSMSVCKY